MDIALKALLIITAYLIGSISPSIILGKIKGIDIKKEGSGNAGTTNALRVLGKKAAIITLVCDILKGVISSLAGVLCFDYSIGGLCAIAVFVGHIWPVYYKFKGGKGAATAVGAIFGLDYRLALISLFFAAIALFISKRMSVGTLVAAVLFPIATLFLNKELILVSVVISVIVILKHKSNIGRLIKGEEPIMSIFEKEN